MQMALIVEACDRRSVCKRGAASNEPLCQRDASLKNVCVRRESQLAREGAEQLVPAETCFLCKFGQSDRCRRICVDPLARAPDARCGTLVGARSRGRMRPETGDELENCRFVCRLARHSCNGVHKRALEEAAQNRVCEHRLGKREGFVCSSENIRACFVKPRGVEIQDAPRPRASPNRAPVVHLVAAAVNICQYELNRPS